jgi:tRNA (guanine-N7-)-methyltransferase
MGQHGRMHAQCGAAPALSPKLSDSAVPTQRDLMGYSPVTSFRSRRSALSSAQQQTWQQLWPEYGLDARRSAGTDMVSNSGALDTSAWFGRDAPDVLEIGCGAGTSTLAMAHDEPDIDVIAVDLYRRGLAQLLCAVERENVRNIRLIRGDAVDIVEHLFTPNTLTGVRIFFPDPWPKARHHKRRLLQPATVALIADRLRPGGVLHAATDHTGYAEHIAATGDAEPRLCRIDSGSRPVISVTRPMTKYETKARYAGSDVTELLWQRC